MLSWRYLVDEGGYGVTSDLLSHSVDLAHFLVGDITEVVGVGATFITERPLPAPGGTHYDRGAAGGPSGAVTNEDYAAAIVRFAGGAIGTFESSRTMVGPESQNAFDVHGTLGSLSWNLERMNELQVHVTAADDPLAGYTTVFGGERFGDHGAFVPGRANPIGFEDLVTIEDHHFLTAVAEGRPFEPGFGAALAYARVQAALLTSWETALVDAGRATSPRGPPREDRPPHHRRRRRALPRRPANRDRRHRRAARARRVRHLRPRQRHVPRSGVARRR